MCIRDRFDLADVVDDVQGAQPCVYVNLTTQAQYIVVAPACCSVQAPAYFDAILKYCIISNGNVFDKPVAPFDRLLVLSCWLLLVRLDSPRSSARHTGVPMIYIQHHCAAGRVHEEYREITTHPIQKIIAPLRNNPLFSKPPAMKGAAADQELVPLTAGSSRDDSATSVPSARTGPVPMAGRTVASPEAPTRAGSSTGGPVQEHCAEFSAASSLDHKSSMSGDLGYDQVAPPVTVGGSALAALVGAKPHRGSGRGKTGVTKLQSHVD